MTLRIAFFGLPLAACLLARDGHDIVLAVLSPVDGPGFRRLQRLIGSERIIEASKVGGGLNREVETRLVKERPDLVVSWFWTRLLPERWLEVAPKGAIGAHPSLLPRHRGPNPFFWAIDSGDLEAGVTLHTLSPEYDTGDILLTESLPIEERNAWQLARALDRPSLRLVREAAARISEGQELPRTPQQETLASWAPEPSGALLHADFHWTTERVLRRIRALSPVPGLALEISGLPFFITQARRAHDFVRALEPGEAGIIAEPSRVIVRTADGAIQVERALLPNDDAETEAEAGTVVNGETLAELVAQRLAQSSCSHGPYLKPADHLVPALGFGDSGDRLRTSGGICMTDPVTAARAARENLARGLAALQSPGVPQQIMSVAEPIAHAMSALHRIESTAGAAATEAGPMALNAARQALGLLQSHAQAVRHPAIEQAMESIAGSLSLVHGLSYGPAPAAAPMQYGGTVAMGPGGPPPMPQQHYAPQQAQQYAAPAQQPPPQAYAQQAPQAYAQQPAAPPPQQAWQQPAPAAAPPAQQWQQPAAAPPAGTSGEPPMRVEAALGAHSTTNFYKGLSGNDVIDSGGIFIATYQIPAIGRQLMIKVSMPGGYEFEALGVVRWTRNATSSDSDSPPGYGAQFTQISPEGRQLVYRYVRNREPLFHDDL